MSAAPRAADIVGASNVRSAAMKRIAADWSVRAVAGALLALVAVLITFAGGFVFAGFLAATAFAALREWHRLVGSARYGREFVASAAGVFSALVCAAIYPHSVWPLAFLTAGALLSAAMAAPTSRLWSALGALYIGVPAWSLVALRLGVHNAAWVVLGVFLVIWSADTGALVVGRFVGGPKLIPALSPNKTWAGLAGGLILPATVGAFYVAALGGSAGRAFVLAVPLALAGHAGDLFESWVKRRVGRKDSGELIPGHGGVLDRLDSTLFVAPLASALILLFGVAQLFGVHS